MASCVGSTSTIHQPAGAGIATRIVLRPSTRPIGVRAEPFRVRSNPQASGGARRGRMRITAPFVRQGHCSRPRGEARNCPTSAAPPHTSRCAAPATTRSPRTARARRTWARASRHASCRRDIALAIRVSDDFSWAVFRRRVGISTKYLHIDDLDPRTRQCAHSWGPAIPAKPVAGGGDSRGAPSPMGGAWGGPAHDHPAGCGRRVITIPVVAVRTHGGYRDRARISGMSTSISSTADTPPLPRCVFGNPNAPPVADGAPAALMARHADAWRVPTSTRPAVTRSPWWCHATAPGLQTARDAWRVLIAATQSPRRPLDRMNCRAHSLSGPMHLGPARNPPNPPVSRSWQRPATTRDIVPSNARPSPTVPMPKSARTHGARPVPWLTSHGLTSPCPPRQIGTPLRGEHVNEVGFGEHFDLGAVSRERCRLDHLR